MSPSLPSSIARLLIFFSAVAISSGLLTACKTMDSFIDWISKPRVTVTLIGSSAQNLDEKGSPLSVVVRLYSLRSKDRIEKVSMRTLQRSDQEALGGDLVDRKEKILRPGEKEEVIVSLKEKDKPEASRAEYVAVVAFLRKPEGESWRQIIPLNNSKPDVEVLVQERGMKITLD